ncbi:MAG: CCA tRNA nucleotidyltransferase [Alphaproteobacteria bacterium]|nr:CCA tRNA nucleotidyltransferase [Alphaproteobacteria bacterium]
MTAPETVTVVDALTQDGATVRFVGGCVRDAVAGRPVGDIDIATPDPPETVVALLEAAGLRALPTGLAHGTVTALSGDRHYEITTLRIDLETDGRRAVVAFTDDWTADAARRDLTINAISADRDGRLHDPFDGIADLKAGRVRFVGAAEERIREDVLRLLRFFRFYAHYGVPPPDPDGLAACRALAPLVPNLSGERVQAELFKLLAADSAAEVMALIAEEGVLTHVLPEAVDVARLRGLIAVEAALAIDGRQIRRLAAVLTTSPAGIDDVAERLRLSGADRAYLHEVAAASDGFAPVAEERARRHWFYWHGAQLYRELLLLDAARQGGIWPGLTEQLAEAAAWSRPSFPLNGDDVLALGVVAGPEVGVLLRTIESWWVGEDFGPDRAACLARLLAEYRAGGGSVLHRPVNRGTT